MSERTCVMVKPDGVCSAHLGAVIDRLERAGLRLAALKLLRLSPSQAEAFYQEHHGKPFYEGLIRFMTSAPVAAMVWEGPLAISRTRALMGATDSAKAEPGTLRREFGTDNRYNLVHGSDSPASADREIRFFFKADELYAYGPSDWRID